MHNSSPSSRRQFIRILGLGAASGSLVMTRTLNAQGRCGLTPAQTAGPFYPGESQFSAIEDLTRVPNSNTRAAGQIVYVRGRVVDEDCQPVANANVEIWQACATGRYNNRNDPNPAALDPNFRYWAEAFTVADGLYQFKTIIPGAYPADEGWTRPPHIHFRISCRGYQELITQMYFAGDALNDSDLILRRIPADERESVIVSFTPSPEGLEPGTLLGNFDITLKKVRRP